MTTVFLISGFRLDHTAATLPEFRDFIAKLERKNYRVIPVDISYRKKTHTVFVKEFLQQYTKEKTEKNIVIGNSFGAVVALLSAEKFRPSELYLCSISPFFAETLKDPRYMAYTTKRFGLRRALDLRKYSFNQLAQSLSVHGIPTHFLYGEKEKEIYPPLVSFTKMNYKKVSNAELREIKGAPHSLKDPAYYEAVVGLL